MPWVHSIVVAFYIGEGMGRLILVYLYLKIVINTRRNLSKRLCFSHCRFSINYCNCSIRDTEFVDIYLCSQIIFEEDCIDASVL